MSPHPLSSHSGIARVALAVAMGAVLTIGLSAPSFARPHLGGGGGGNVGGHFSGTVHFSGGGMRPGAGGGGIHRPIPPHPRPIPHPVHPLPHPPHPPGPPHPPYPPGPHPYPHPHPAWWMPGVAAWDAAWDAATLIYVLPTSCRTVIVNSVKYAECGSAWYEMVYHGTQLAYLPVPDPR